MVAIDAHGLFRLAPGATEWERLGPEVPVGGLLIHEDGRILVTSENRVLALSSDKSSWDLAFDAGAAILQMEVDEDGALWLATQAGVLREEDGALVPVGEGSCGGSARGIFVGGGRIYCQAADYSVAELLEGLWITIPYLSPREIPATPLAAGPDGNLYLGYGVTGNGALVRTQP